MSSVVKRKKKIPVRIPTAKEIRDIRKALKLTQEQAAEKIGVLRRAWINYEKGSYKVSPPIAILIRLLSEKKL